jgi:aryl-alcohol dehydrogenase
MISSLVLAARTRSDDSPVTLGRISGRHLMIVERGRSADEICVHTASGADLVEAVRKITGSTVDYAIDCTGVIPVIEQLAETEGMLGTLVLVGGAPANPRFSVDHLRALWGKRIIGVLGGGGRSGQLIPALVELYEQGRFPFDRLVRYYEMDELEKALADSKSGEVIKPILRMPR